MMTLLQPVATVSTPQRRIQNDGRGDVTALVVDMHALWADAPVEVVAALFEPFYRTTDGRVVRLAEPDLDTGKTKFTPMIGMRSLTVEGQAALMYASQNIRRVGVEHTIAPGVSIALPEHHMILYIGGAA